MKTATIPSLRVEPELRHAVESVFITVRPYPVLWYNLYGPISNDVDCNRSLSLAVWLRVMPLDKLANTLRLRKFYVNWMTCFPMLKVNELSSSLHQGC